MASAEQILVDQNKTSLIANSEPSGLTHFAMRVKKRLDKVCGNHDIALDDLVVMMNFYGRDKVVSTLQNMLAHDLSKVPSLFTFLEAAIGSSKPVVVPMPAPKPAIDHERQMELDEKTRQWWQALNKVLDDKPAANAVQRRTEILGWLETQWHELPFPEAMKRRGFESLQDEPDRVGLAMIRLVLKKVYEIDVMAL